MSDSPGGLRRLPSVDSLLRDERAERVSAGYPRDMFVRAVREALDGARILIWGGGPVPDRQWLLDDAGRRLRRSVSPSLRPVINATGVIIHTNLGRAPLSDDALLAVLQTSAGYSNLEYRLDEGTRGSRHDHLADLLKKIAGAEDALAVNNNASAVLLVLSALAQGREVIVSRSQAVEIGGGFRIPDVLRQSGAKLVDVGTTNRTYVQDYADAITPDTAILLHVHPSNFRVEGFVHSPTIEELVELGERAGLPVVDDLGSGSLLDTTVFGLQHEPTVQERIQAGVALVCFSGDKLLGGPQAGLIAGKSSYVEMVRRHPLARAVRIDKMAIAALSATLRHYLLGNATEKIPVWRMISAPLDVIDRRAGRIARRLRHAGIPAQVIQGISTIGGGSLPGETLPTRLVAVAARADGPEASRLVTALRAMDPPLVARVEHGMLVIDPRTVEESSDGVVVAHVRAVASTAAPA